MALSRSDHKRIALSIAAELKKVIGGANGDRLLAKRKGRMAPPAPPADEDSDMDAMMADMAGPQETPAEDDADVFGKAIPSFRRKKGSKGFPPKK